MTSQHEQVEVTLDVDKGITPNQLAKMLAEQGLKPLLRHASATDLGRSYLTPKFEDGLDTEVIRMLEEYYEGLLSDAELGSALSKVRLRLLDWTVSRGVEVAEVDLRNLAEDGRTHLHQPDEFQDQSNQPRLAVFMPPKIPGPTVALHNPLGTGRIALRTNRAIGGEILHKGIKPPRTRAIIQDPGQRIAAKTPKIQEDGETLMMYAPVHSSGWSPGHHPHRVPDFRKLDNSQMGYHTVVDLNRIHEPPVAVFSRRLKD